jgi:hypothetical protein
MTSKLFLVLLITTTINAFGFEVGSGSQFSLALSGQKAELNIYVASKTNKKLRVEFHMGTKGILATNLWQQFDFKVYNKGPVAIEASYIQTSINKKPERMTAEFFHQNEGVQVQDFLFSNKEQIEGDFIGDELIEVPAGSLIAKHYRKKRDGQVIDFWISEEVKPIALVKLESKSTKLESNNYRIELVSLLRNVKATIDPKKSIPLTKKTKSTFLTKKK